MAFPVNGTKLADLINPQVMADLIETKLTDEIKFATLAEIDYSLVDRPGSTLTLPSYAYIGDASDVAEGDDIPISKLSETPVTVTVKKAGKGVQITDEAILSGYGDPLNEAIKQEALAIASKVDNDFLTALSNIGAGMTYQCAGAAATADDIATALVKFGEDIDGDKYILVSPNQYAALRKADDWCPASDVAAELLINGVVGMIHGCVVVVSNKLAESGALYIVKPGALRLITKRETAVETARDIINKSTVLTADKHYAAYLYDSSKAIKMTVNF